MTIEELVKKYEITIHSEKPPMIKIANGAQAKKDNVLEKIKMRKDLIIAYLHQKEEEAKVEAEKQAAREYERKLAAITGYKKLCQAIEADKEYREECRRCQKEGLFPRPNRRMASPAEVRKKHPMAAAFEKAVSYSLADHRVKAAVGERAKNAILNNPKSYAEVIREMEGEWAAYVEEIVWD